MRLDEYASLDGLALAELIRKGDIAPHEPRDLALLAIEKLNPMLNAVTAYDNGDSTVSLPEVRGDAVFGFVPILIKDLPFRQGMLAEMGSQLTKGYRAESDLEISRRLAKAGTVIVGRSASSEMALAATTENRLNGQTSNPWDPARSAAGSSGGAAAATAAGIVPLAQGTDGGGSIRMPASACGLVGLKPSRGRVTSQPVEAMLHSGLTTAFVLTRSIRDCAAMLDVMSGPAPGDPFEIPQTGYPFLRASLEPIERLRIGFTTAAFSGLPVDSEVKRAAIDTANLCSSMGHEVEEAGPVFSYDAYLEAQKIIWCAHVAREVTELAEHMGRSASRVNLLSTTLALCDAGRDISATAFLKALGTYNGVCRQVAAFFEHHDLLLSPTLTVPPVPLGSFDLDPEDASVDTIFQHLGPFESFTSIFNATGQPAVSLPLACTLGGLPIGIQFVARFGKESTLLRLGAEMERARPWDHIRPKIHAGNLSALLGYG